MTVMENFIEGITAHISKKRNVDQRLVLDIIADFKDYREELLVKEGLRLEIEGEGEFVLEIPVSNLLMDLSKERAYYKSLCEKHGIK